MESASGKRRTVAPSASSPPPPISFPLQESQRCLLQGAPRRAELVPPQQEPLTPPQSLMGSSFLPSPGPCLQELLTAYLGSGPAPPQIPPLHSPPGRREHSDTLRPSPLPGAPKPPGPKPCGTVERGRWLPPPGTPKPPPRLTKRARQGQRKTCPAGLTLACRRREGGGARRAPAAPRGSAPPPPLSRSPPCRARPPSPQGKGQARPCPAAPPPRLAAGGTERHSLLPSLLRGEPSALPSGPGPGAVRSAALTPGRRRSCCRPDRRKDQNPPSPPQPPPRASVTGPRPEDPAPLIYGGARARAAPRGACLQLSAPPGLSAPPPVGKSRRPGAQRPPQPSPVAAPPAPPWRGLPGQRPVHGSVGQGWTFIGDARPGLWLCSVL